MANAKYSATNVIPPVRAVVKRLPCRITQFAPNISQGGGKNQQPPSVNLDPPDISRQLLAAPPHISETIEVESLNFTHIWTGPSAVFGNDNFSPQLPEPLAQWVPQRVKVENFLYILHSSGPRRVQLHQ